MEADPRDRIIESLARRVFLQSELLTAAAQRLGWDSDIVQSLITQLRESTRSDVDASVYK